jgi:hypothetical protein
MESKDCEDYLKVLEIPTPQQILHALLSHAVFNFNMSGAGVLTDVEQIQDFLTNCDDHQITHLRQFASCLNVVGVLLDSGDSELIREGFNQVREELDQEYIEAVTRDVSLEEVFFGGEEAGQES